MTNRTWNATTGCYETAADWQDGVVPVIGDSINVLSGTVTLRASSGPQPGSYDGLAFILGATSRTAPATIVPDGANLGRYVSITTVTTGGFAMLGEHRHVRIRRHADRQCQWRHLRALGRHHGQRRSGRSGAGGPIAGECQRRRHHRADRPAGQP